ncbi:MAG TPA: Spy/CpxP family protein refolding chaperone [Thermodesulfobacteriota bacterium]|nr:Spy/CpxP family protein refolding chaperone [Thermodesulfobacteriota bacterium]
MRTRRRLALAPLAALALFALHAAASAAAPHARSPYAGREAREIKALPPDEVQALLAGEGAGLALAAELNRYPGPRHVLELAAELALTDAQRRAARAIYERMREQAVRLGEAIVEQERVLDRAFAERAIDEPRLRTLVAEIARLRGELRAVHLAAHLETARLLSPEQIAEYAALRGYGGPAGPRGDGHTGRGRQEP